ncbi:MAG: alginate export family protein [Deltaproteobacteria bacterium]|nr:alginate export family protein [Deltaproteobacteria bacterium]
MKLILSLALVCFAFLSHQQTHAQELVGQRLKLTGQWTGTSFTVTRTQQRDARGEDPRRGQITGQIHEINPTARTLRVGPLLIQWTDTTQFKETSPAALAVDQVVQVKGRVSGPGPLRATEIKPEVLAADRLEMLGSITEGGRRADGALRLTMLGVSVDIPKGIHTSGSELTKRPDDRPPEEQFTFTFLNRPMTIGGKLETTSLYRDNFELSPSVTDARFRFGQELQLQLLYALSEKTSLFLEGQIAYEAELYNKTKPRELEWAFGRGQTWLYMSNLFESPVSLQLGRQSIRERRSWWWDDDLDAVRLHYDRQYWHVEIAFAQELAREATDEKHIAPRHHNVLRLFGSSSWSWDKNQRIDTFFLYHHDHSRRQSVGNSVQASREDPSDASLAWFGGRASGKLDLDRFGEMDYRLEGAGVAGHEVVFDFEDDEQRKSRSQVSSRFSRKVMGWALDNSLSWETRVPGRPTLSVGYAVGSGDRHPDRGTDHAFRQTGLHDNKGRFRGVNRFRYYGELLRPDLSNLQIWTVALGFCFWKDSSVEFAYHLYDQLYAAPVLLESRVNADPTGKRKGIGQEWDIIVGLEEWEQFQIEVIGALFRAGPAYGRSSGEIASSISFQLQYNF